MADIVVLWYSPDRAAALPIAKGLRTHGFEVFEYSHDMRAGDRIVDAVQAQIRSAKLALLCLSDAALEHSRKNGDWLATEAALCLERFQGRPDGLMLARVGALSRERLPVTLERRNVAELVPGDGFEERFESLVRDMRRKLGPARGEAVRFYRDWARKAHANLVPPFPGANRELFEVYVELELERDARGAKHTRAVELEHSERRRFTLRELLAHRDPAGPSRAGRYAVLGEPGSGKTTSARCVAWQLGEPADSAPVAVYASLPRLLRENKHPFHLAEDAAKATLGDARASGIAQTLFEHSKHAGQVLLLLDGLDEVSAEDMDRARALVGGYARDLKEVAIAVFSRAIGYRDVSSEFARATLRPLSEERQRALLENWVGKTAALEVWSRIAKQPALRSLTGNPLLLTLVASLALSEPELPASRAKLYDLAIDHLLRRGYGAEPKSVRDVRAARLVLAQLARKLQDSPKESWTLDELDETLREVEKKREHAGRWRDAWSTRAHFLEDVATVSNLLAPEGGAPSDREAPWRFLHRQLRERLAAEALERGGEKCLEELIGELDADDIPRWAETIGLACSISKEPAAALKALHGFSAPTARRVLPEVEGMEPRAMLDFLLADLKWEAEDLVRLVRCWTSLGWTAARVQELLLERCVPMHHGDLDRFGMVLWATRRAGVELERTAYFEACNLPVRPSVELEYVRILAGTLRMGSPEGSSQGDEHPQHLVTVPSFELARTTVTRAQFLELADQYPFPKVKGVAAKQAGNLPANEVSWWAAYLYCAWIGARLPSEAEWEYACRAGTTSEYSFGSDVSELEDHAWYFVNFGQRVLPPKTRWESQKLDEPWGCRIHAVGEKKPNPWGLFDMHGNVWEWCQDKYRGTYEGAPVDGSALEDEASEDRVIRGGSFVNSAEFARSAFRLRHHPSYRWLSLGFRPARSVTAD